MERIFSLITDFKLGGTDSFTDRMSCHYTVAILFAFAVMTTTRQYISEPISCWCPVQLTRDQVDYVNKVCWTTSTYYLPEDVINIPKGDEVTNKISFYQWIPLLALAQGVMFYFPKILWNALNQKSGLPISSITNAAIDKQRKHEQQHSEKVNEFMVKTLGKFFKDLCWNCYEYNSDYNRDTMSETRKIMPAPQCFKRISQSVYVSICSRYVTVLYLIIKLFYIGNILLQIHILNIFLDSNYTLYGLEVAQRLIRGENWATSSRFPRIALCNFAIRAPGSNSHEYTVQCALPINLVHEIFYIFLWFWFILVLVASIFSFIGWTFTALPLFFRKRMVRNLLYADGRIRRRLDSNQDRWLTGFICNYLGTDGCFLVKMVAKNTTDILTAEFLGGLWQDYLIKTKKFESFSEGETVGKGNVGYSYSYQSSEGGNNSIKMNTISSWKDRHNQMDKEMVKDDVFKRPLIKA